MRLSMWMLYDKLADFNPKAEIVDGKAEIYGARFFPYGIEMRHNIVYIGYSCEFFGNIENQVLLAYGRDMIIIGCADATEIFNSVLSIFEKYTNWDKRLNEARSANEPYQALLDIAHEIFQCPMLFGCKNLQIYAITTQYTDDQVYKGWDEVKTIKTTPLWLLKYLNTLNIVDWYPDEIDPAIMPTWPGMRFEHQIRVNCYLNGEVWGHLLLYHKEKDIKPSTLQLASHVSEIFSTLLEERLGKSTEKNAVHSWLSDQLDGRVFEADAYRTLFWSLLWSETDWLVLYRVMPLAKVNDQKMFYWLCDSITVQAPNAIVFPYKMSIVVIMRNNEEEVQIVLDAILRLLQLNEYHCGISFSFQGFENIQTYYRQAGYAIELAPDSGSKIHSFASCSLDGIALEFKTTQHWKGWITPALFSLQETDTLQGSEYYATLHCYLVNKCHIGNTAKSLYVHRNTVINRLEKIKEIMNLNMHDEDVLAYLRFCFSLMSDTNPHRKAPNSV